MPVSVMFDSAIVTAVVSLVVLLVILFKAIKAPPPARALRWRGMTESSLLSYPGFYMAVIFGLAVIVAMIFSK